MFVVRTLAAGALAVSLAVGGGRGQAASVSPLLVSGPALAGDSVAWIEAGAGQTVRVWSGRGARTVYEEVGGHGIDRLAGGDAAIAFRRIFEPCPQCALADEVVGGRPGRSFAPLHDPARCYLPWATNEVDVSGSVVVFEWSDCAQDRRAVVVKDVAQSGPALIHRNVFTGRACCTGAHVAGRFVAWIDGWGSRVVVYDRPRARVAYAAYLPARYGAGAFDVQADGKVAVVGAKALLWFSPAEPRRAHVIPFATRRGPTAFGAERIRLAGDRIAALRDEGGLPKSLEVVDLSGRRLRSVRFDARTVPVHGFDFDGERLVWSSATIRSTRLDCPTARAVPCIERASGTMRIRLAEGDDVRKVASFEFVDVALRSLVPEL